MSVVSAQFSRREVSRPYLTNSTTNSRESVPQCQWCSVPKSCKVDRSSWFLVEFVVVPFLEAIVAFFAVFLTVASSFSSSSNNFNRHWPRCRPARFSPSGDSSLFLGCRLPRSPPSFTPFSLTSELPPPSMFAGCLSCTVSSYKIVAPMLVILGDF